MDLADRIISNSPSNSYGPLDEFGFPLRCRNGLNYTVARIIIRNPYLCVNPHDDRVYDLSSPDRAPIDECNKMVMLLSGFDSPFAKSYKYALVFDKLREILPEADMESIEVCDGLVFDGKTKELTDIETKDQENARFCSVVALLNKEGEKDEDQ